MKPIFEAMLAIGISLLGGQNLFAQEAYPNKAVKLVVPFAMGGGTDQLGRIVAERLSALWNRTVSVENRPGLSGAIGSDAVAKSSNDGYTLLLGTATTHAVAPALNSKIPYNVQRDFAPITEIATSPFVLLVHPTVPANSIKELVLYAKSKPGAVTYNGSVGTGSHMAMELLAARAGGIEMQAVADKGTGPAMIDLVAGQLQAGFNDVPAALPYLREGKLRALGVTSSKRTSLLPQVPTIAESGYPGYDADAWYGVFAPMGTPPYILKKISADLRAVMTEPSTRKKLEDNGYTLVLSSPSEFSLRVKNDIQKWRTLVADAKIKVN